MLRFRHAPPISLHAPEALGLGIRSTKKGGSIPVLSFKCSVVSKQADVCRDARFVRVLHVADLVRAGVQELVGEIGQLHVAEALILEEHASRRDILAHESSKHRPTPRPAPLACSLGVLDGFVRL
eukprot:scaffold340_cov256-Pinguiococcus_pyrenoidosus.AAC.53